MLVVAVAFVLLVGAAADVLNCGLSREETSDHLELFSRVVRGPNWKTFREDEDGRGEGRVVSLRYDDAGSLKYVTVSWDSGVAKNIYYANEKSGYDVMLSTSDCNDTTAGPTPTWNMTPAHCGLSGSETAALLRSGSRVVAAGRDWRWGGEDGGGPGTVLAMSSVLHTGVAQVLWDDSQKQQSVAMGSTGTFGLWLAACPDNTPASRGCRLSGLETAALLVNGSRVVSRDDTSRLGTVVDVKQYVIYEGWVWVKWDNGRQSSYRMGKIYVGSSSYSFYDLQLAVSQSPATPRELPTTEGATEPPTTAGATEPPTTAGATEPPTTEGTTEPPTTDGATEPPTTDGATEPPTTEGATEPATTEGAMEPPTTEGATQPPTTEGATEPPTAEGATQPPTTEGATEPPTTEDATEPPTTEGATEPPTTEGATEPPTTEGATEPPTTEGATEPPTTEGATEPPTTEDATEPPTTEGATKPPTTEGATEPPTTEGATESPTTDGATETPTTEGATQPPTTEGATQPPTTEGATEPPTTEGVTEPPTTEGATEPPTTEGATEPPTTEVVTEFPTTKPPIEASHTTESPTTTSDFETTVEVTNTSVAPETTSETVVRTSSPTIPSASTDAGSAWPPHPIPKSCKPSVEYLLLPVPGHCDKYSVCSAGRSQLMSCPRGTLFNYQLQTCDWPAEVDCSIYG